MASILKTSVIALFAASISLAAARPVSAQQTGGNNGNSNGGGTASSGNGPGSPEEISKEPRRTTTSRYIIIVPEDSSNRRRPQAVQPDPMKHASCAHLYHLINQSNMMKTVPDYQKCIRENGS